jgi:hypothetical protein
MIAEAPEASKRALITRNYRRDPPVVLSEEQKLGQYQSTGPFALTQTMSNWQH